MPIPLIPLRLAGLVLAGRTLSLKTGGKPFAGKAVKLPKSYNKPVHSMDKSAPVPNPLQNLFKGLSSSLSGLSSSLTGLTSSISRLVKKPPKEDYDAAVKRFLPENAKLITPKYPLNTDKYTMSDLDGDSADELVASYNHGEEIKTIVLKKQKDQWEKISEITNRHGKLSYLGHADITGEGRKQLLLGLKTKDGLGELHGYSLKDGKTYELFAHNYNRMEILDNTNIKGTKGNAQIAIWDKNGINSYDVRVIQWDGNALYPVENQKAYYYNRVLPYYVQKVKQMPQNPSNWYNLADSLLRTEYYREGLEAVEIGMSLRPSLPSMEDFLKLKSRIARKMKG